MAESQVNERPSVLSEIHDITALVSGIEFHCAEGAKIVAEMRAMMEVVHQIRINWGKYLDSIDDLRDLKTRGAFHYNEAEKKLKAAEGVGNSDVGQMVLHAEAWNLLPTYQAEIDNGFDEIDYIFERY